MDEHFLESLKSTLTEAFGELRFVKFINEMIWVAFNNYKLAIDAVLKGSIEVCFLVNFIVLELVRVLKLFL